MSMGEIERAIEYLAPTAEYPTMTVEYCKNLKVAVKALREQAEREKGCERCQGGRRCNVCLNAGNFDCCEDCMQDICNYFNKSNYCPKCGRKLTKEERP
jgi:hypothetical protein